MGDEIRKLLLYLKRSTGKYEFSETEIMNTISIKSRYLTPDQVKDFIRIAVENRCLTLINGQYRITCSLDGIDISLEYRPDFNLILESKDARDDTDLLISEIVNKTGKSKKEVAAEINRIRERNPYLGARTAALIIARLAGIEIDKFLESRRSL
ncbi:MAG: DUF2240 family protein [Thermoplasmatales archaeon]